MDFFVLLAQINFFIELLRDRRIKAKPLILLSVSGMGMLSGSNFF